MLNQFSRTELLLGKENMNKLHDARVAVFGVGGVGGYVVEALARSGIGTLDIIDNDRVSLTNINRQLHAVHSTLGEYKVDVAERRCKDINPDIVINKYTAFYLPETSDQFDFTVYDYVVDCIDTVTGKIRLVLQAEEAGVPIISSMGTGNKLDPSKLTVTDIAKTSVDPLAKVMRHELRKRNISHLKVVYSTEEPLPHDPEAEKDLENDSTKRSIPGSSAFVPPAAGLLIASEVVKDLLK